MPSLCSPRSQPEVSDGVPDDPLARAGTIGLRESGEIAAGRGIGRRTQLKSLLLNTAIGRDVVRGNVLGQMRELPILPCPAAAIQAFEHGEGRSISHPKKLEFLDAWNYREWFNLLGFPAAGPASQLNSPEAVGEEESVWGVLAAVDGQGVDGVNRPFGMAPDGVMGSHFPRGDKVSFVALVSPNCRHRLGFARVPTSRR